MRHGKKDRLFGTYSFEIFENGSLVQIFFVNIVCMVEKTIFCFFGPAFYLSVVHQYVIKNLPYT